jgi:hypothetical protein
MRRRVIASVVLFAALLSACSSSNSKSTGTPSSTNRPPVIESGPGVNDTTVKVGVLMIDYSCIPRAAYDHARPEQQKIFQLYIDYINKHGGAGGRQIVPVYKSYCPLNNTEELTACTSLTEDEHVFATVGFFYDPSGDAQLCFVKKHKTPIIADSITQELVSKAPPGLMVSPDITPDRRLRVIMALLKDRHTLDGKKVAILAESTSKDRVKQIIQPALQSMDVQRGTDASIVVNNGADTSAAQQQLSSFIERWKEDGTNALVLAGDAVSSAQFVENVKKAIPDMLLVADTTSVLEGGRDEQKAGVRPNPYDGIITAEGQTGVQHSQSPHGKYCHGIYKEATGRDVPSPLAVLKTPSGLVDDLYGEIEDGCLYPMMFKAIADRVGKNLNADTWAAAVNNFGHIEDMSTIYASVHQGKYDADDTYGLVAYDHTIGDAGDWKQLSPVQDVGNA